MLHSKLVLMLALQFQLEMNHYRDHAISFCVEKPEDLLEFVDLIFGETHFELNLKNVIFCKTELASMTRIENGRLASDEKHL